MQKGSPITWFRSGFSACNFCRWIIGLGLLLLIRSLLKQLRLRPDESGLIGGRSHGLQGLRRRWDDFVDVAPIAAFGRPRKELDFGLGKLVSGGQDEPFL